MRHALLIGVEKYENFSATRFAHADVDLMHSTLTEYCDYKPENVRRYKLDESSGLTPKQLLEGIDDFSKQTDSSHTILFYFAGHGHLENGETYLLLPSTKPSNYESTAVNLNEIAVRLRQDQKSCIRIFDACHSGADVRDSTDQSIHSDEFVRSITSDTTGWVTLAGCAPSQSSYSDPTLGQGVFTHYLCKEIRTIPVGKKVYPELLKVPVCEKVSEHARKMGYDQSPTLNASISGNITLASRVDPAPQNQGISEENRKENLKKRIESVSNPLEISHEYLKELLGAIVDHAKQSIPKLEYVQGVTTVSEEEYLDDIPYYMQERMIRFAERQGFISKHVLKSKKNYKTRAIYEHPFLPRELDHIEYIAEQSYDLPKSAAKLDFIGDGRCIPNLEILVYVIPLQITTCNVIAAWNSGWNKTDEPELIKIYYENRAHAETEKLADSVVGFSTRNLSDELEDIVENRVKYLEKEIADAK